MIRHIRRLHDHGMKRWPETWHVTIGTSITILLIFSLVFGIGYGFPAKPLSAQERAALDQQILQLKQTWR